MGGRGNMGNSDFIKSMNFVLWMTLSRKENMLKQYREAAKWGDYTPWLKAMLQSYTNQNGMVLVQEETYRLVEQNREPRHKPMYIWFINIL